MGKQQKSASAFEITCPCCHAMIKVDPETQGIISHVAAVKPKTFADLDAAAVHMKDAGNRRDSLFEQSVLAEKNKKELMEKKFQDALKKAKESPDTGKPIRDFDLD